MAISTIVIIILGTAGALLVGMAALIKAMVLGVLQEIKSDLTGLSRDMHRMDLRLTKLEAEHEMAHRCRFAAEEDR